MFLNRWAPQLSQQKNPKIPWLPSEESSSWVSATWKWIFVLNRFIVNLTWCKDCYGCWLLTCLIVIYCYHVTMTFWHSSWHFPNLYMIYIYIYIYMIYWYMLYFDVFCGSYPKHRYPQFLASLFHRVSVTNLGLGQDGRLHHRRALAQGWRQWWKS